LYTTSFKSKSCWLVDLISFGSPAYSTNSKQFIK
jgi:hypothetical protein